MLPEEALPSRATSRCETAQPRLQQLDIDDVFESPSPDGDAVDADIIVAVASMARAAAIAVAVATAAAAVISNSTTIEPFPTHPHAGGHVDHAKDTACVIKGKRLHHAPGATEILSTRKEAMTPRTFQPSLAT